MPVLVLVEHDGAALRPSTLPTIAAAAELGDAIHLLVAGAGVSAVAEAAAAIPAAARVLIADAPALAHSPAEALAPLVAGLAPGYSHVLAPASTFGKNVLPRAAALADVQMVSDISRWSPPTPSGGRSMPATRSRRCRRPIRSRC